MSCYFRTSDDKGTDIHFGAVPVGNNACTIYSGNYYYSSAYGYLDCIR